ncbi:60S ribosomal protein L14 [Exaiptasia diaphana]|uniref:Large ribosomal subunit protein eL14 n=1 Tax=Exaiptasia diaphana TaxID=2652724 RepID=A0A913XVQ5_EXADI|nr:60S ribosomal protein L14 [Exaiptasia diaphana]KXJ24213.1 60S ribosomal protein L14 [Exaiptasia diaphana]
MVYRRFVEVGRVALINSGADMGKLCVIVDIVDQNRALVDGPCTSVCRQAINFKHLSLTDFKIKVGRSARSGPVKKAFEAEQVQDKWEKTNWARKLAMRKKRTSMNDFDRFKLKLAKQKKNRILRAEVKKLKKEEK